MSRWIKMRYDLVEDPRVDAIVQRLGIDLDAVLGKLYRVWSWVGAHTRRLETDKRLANVSQRLDNVCERLGAVTARHGRDWIDRLARQPGFAEALIAVGWLEEIEGGLLWVNFHEHNWEPDHAQGLARARWRRWYQRQKAKKAQSAAAAREGEAPNVAKRSPNVGQTLANASSPIPIPDTLPSEEKKKAAPPPVVFPETLNTDRFRAAWEAWVTYRRESRLKAWAASTIKRQLEEFAQWGEERAIAAIEHTIKKGWQGIREPDGPAPTGSNGRARPSVEDIIARTRAQEGNP